MHVHVPVHVHVHVHVLTLGVQRGPGTYLELGGEHARSGPQLRGERGAEARVQAREEEEEDNGRLVSSE